MRRYLLATALATGACLVATVASAATVVGNTCPGNAMIVVGNEGTLFPLVNGPASTTPISVPAAGIATRWAVGGVSASTSFRERLKVLRLVPGANQVKLITATPIEEFSAGHEFVPIRLPVQAGDRFGASGPTGVLGCIPAAAGDTAGATDKNGPPGATEAFTEISNSQAALTVTVEPDVDGDGYGDETQDGCPWNAAVQVECPPVTVKVDSAKAKERAIVVELAVSTQAQVQVFGQVSWRVRQKPGQGSERERRSDRGLTVGLTAGAPRTVLPGTAASFRVTLPRTVLRRLGRINPAQALRPRITIRTTDLAGRENDRVLTVKLLGRRR